MSLAQTSPAQDLQVSMAQLQLAMRIASEGPDKVLVNAQGHREGSESIAYGRAAAVAQTIGWTGAQDFFLGALSQLRPASAKPSGFPTVEMVAAAYHATPEAFAAFADKANFPVGHSGFVNAVGSLAFAEDYLARGADALKGGGNAHDVLAWGAAALRAAGQKELAATLETQAQALQQQVPATQVQEASVASQLAQAPAIATLVK